MASITKRNGKYLVRVRLRGNVRTKTFRTSTDTAPKSPPPNEAAAAKTYALPAFCATPFAILKPPKSCRTTLPNGATAA